ncbi:MAG: endonuclease/exonuclease/phosphatase family protein [Pyrinomonadaceae bacterium]
MHDPLRQGSRVVCLCLALLCVLPSHPFGNDIDERLLTYQELTKLYINRPLPADLESRLDNLLSVAFVTNRPNTSLPPLSSQASLGQYIRVAHWNIERGIEYDALEAALTSEAKFEALLRTDRFPLGREARREILDQASALRAADVIVLNEVDWGMKRSGYRNIAGDLAARLNFHFAFGVEFVELSPVYLNDNPETHDELFSLDTDRYRGLHGTAILSRFPLENVRLIPFKNQPYDWFREEKQNVSMIEKARRKLIKTVFREDAFREVRRGGRTVLLADIIDPRFPSGRATIAATHIEIRTTPKLRQAQLGELLDIIKPIKNPVIIAGDMNTSGQDMTPTNLKREISKRFGKPEYWLRTGVNTLLGLGLIEDVISASLQFGRNHGDPTVRHIPVVMPNEERRFFSQLKDFRFDDGGSIDFRGEAARSTKGRSNTFANSNERDEKGFVTTFRLNRPVKFLGKFKLDWIFVKPVHLFDPSDYQGSYLFAPHFGRTLDAVTGAIESRISDHHPMIVDLPLLEPSIKKVKGK